MRRMPPRRMTKPIGTIDTFEDDCHNRHKGERTKSSVLPRVLAGDFVKRSAGRGQDRTPPESLAHAPYRLCLTPWNIRTCGASVAFGGVLSPRDRQRSKPDTRTNRARIRRRPQHLKTDTGAGKSLSATVMPKIVERESSCGWTLVFERAGFSFFSSLFRVAYDNSITQRRVLALLAACTEGRAIIRRRCSRSFSWSSKILLCTQPGRPPAPGRH